LSPDCFFCSLEDHLGLEHLDVSIDTFEHPEHFVVSMPVFSKFLKQYNGAGEERPP